MSIVAVGVFMTTLDSSIVNISLPKISAAFHVPLNGAVEWVIIAYLVVIASSLLTFGRLTDMLGRKALWTLGLVIFTSSSALCGAAPTLPFLIIFRALQGLGGAMTMAISPAMIMRAFPATERGRALGLNALVVAAGTSAGPILGGVITQALTWRWIFYINVPIGILGIIATLRLLTERLRLRGGQRFDPIGAVLLAASIICLMVGLSFGQELGWHSGTIMGLFAAGAVLFALLLLIERHMAQPIMDLALFRNRLFTAAISSSFLSFLALFAVTFLLPFYLEQLRLFPAGEAGLLLTPVPLTISMIAPWSGFLADRFGSQVLSSLGLAIATLGLWFLSNLTPQASIFAIVWPLAVTGLGQGLFQAPNNSAILGTVPRHRLGIASGFLAIVRVVGQGLSVAVAGAIFTSLGGAAAGAALSHSGAGAVGLLQHTFTHAFRIALLTCMVIASVGVLTSLVRGSTQ
jgi:EmrB/QacA subfamily drug resistance transporter